METDFGDDVVGVLDVDADFTIASPARALGEAALRRLTTDRGGLFYDPEYGYNLRARVNETLDERSTFETAAGVRAELERDERVLSADVTVTRAGEGLDVRALIDTLDGPFRLVLRATEVSVDLLSSEAL
jgi:hypothetical protein